MAALSSLRIPAGTKSTSIAGGRDSAGGLMPDRDQDSAAGRSLASLDPDLGRLLDELDNLKIALLGGDLSPGQLDALSRAVRDQRSATDDPKLEAVLDEIETRAAVELAKLEAAGGAA